MAVAMSVGERVGPWAVSVDQRNAYVEDTRTGELFTTCVMLFPVGYRLGEVWTNGIADCTEFIPRRVRAKARVLAGRLW